MKKYFAIILYRCFVESEYTGGIDIRCCYFEKNFIDEVTSAIQEEPDMEYENSDGKQVVWKLDEIIQIEEVDKLSSGEEVIGFIRDEGEFILSPLESEIENIKQRYETKEAAVPTSQVKKDISVLLNEIVRLKSLID